MNPHQRYFHIPKGAKALVARTFYEVFGQHESLTRYEVTLTVGVPDNNGGFDKWEAPISVSKSDFEKAVCGQWWTGEMPACWDDVAKCWLKNDPPNTDVWEIETGGAMYYGEPAVVG